MSVPPYQAVIAAAASQPNTTAHPRQAAITTMVPSLPPRPLPLPPPPISPSTPDLHDATSLSSTQQPPFAPSHLRRFPSLPLACCYVSSQSKNTRNERIVLTPQMIQQTKCLGLRRIRIEGGARRRSSEPYTTK